MSQKPRYEELERQIKGDKQMEEDTADLLKISEQLKSKINKFQRTKESLQQRAKKLNVLNTLGHRVSSSLAVGQVMEIAFEMIARCVAPSLAMLYLGQGD